MAVLCYDARTEHRVVQAGSQSIAGRFTEIPMFGLAVVVAFTVSECLTNYLSRRRLILWGCGTLLLTFVFLPVVQIGYWRDSETLFRHTLSVEDSDYVRDNLAELLMRDGRNKEAEVQLRAAVRLAPDRFESHNNLANVLPRTGRHQQAKAEASSAFHLAPNNLSVAEKRALIDLDQRDCRTAPDEFDRAARLGGQVRPIAAELSDAGASLASKGRAGDAEPLE